MKDGKAERRPLGRTGLEITPIGLGTWQFAQGTGFDRFVYQGLPQEETNAIVKTALQGGINWFDTAEAYGWGRSERSLATALAAAGAPDDEVLVATKWFPALRTAASIGRTIVRRRQCLKPYSIGLFQVHQPIALASVERQMDAMADLVEMGLARSVGVSNFNAAWMRRAHAALEARGLPLASNQVKVSLMDRHIEVNGVLEAARELGVTIIAWSPLEMGVLTGKFHKDPSLLKSRPAGRRGFLRLQLERSRELMAALQEIAAGNGVSPAVVALSWVVNFYGETVVAIPGATKVSQAEQNVQANRFKLPAEEMERLDLLTRRFRRPIIGRDPGA
jgi:aryl-alcohol dehydrogenase-like predicted oxidoreductase